jgi:hypothetical protein
MVLCFCNSADWSLLVNQKSTSFTPGGGGVGGIVGGTGVGVGVPPLLVLLLQLEEQITRKRQEIKINRKAGIKRFKKNNLIVEDSSAPDPVKYRCKSKLV